MSAVSVRDLMTEDPYTLTPDDTVADLLALMDRYHFRHVPVVVEDRVLVGLVSHRDIVRGALGTIEQLPMSNQHELLTKVLVSEVMQKGIEAVEPDTDITEAGELMMDNKFGCLPVCEGGYLVGILTESDFVRYVVDTTDS